MKNKITLTLVILLTFLNSLARPFITEWGTQGETTITIPTTGGGYNYDVYWEEIGNPNNKGEMKSISGDAVIFNLSPYTLYRIEISGQFPRIYINYNPNIVENIINIVQWGDIEWVSFANSFSGSRFLRLSAQDTPILSGVSDLSNMFSLCRNLSGDNVNWNWETITILNMKEMFYGANIFNGDIGGWDVSNVTDMSGMFFGNLFFNNDIGSWNVRNVTDMESMFRQTNSFNQDLESWNVSNVINMKWMFGYANEFNGKINSWRTINVNSMSSMFYYAEKFNQSLESWDVSSVTDMSYMFSYAISFNQEIGNWDVSNVRNMTGMFQSVTNFNSDISSWDVSKVTNMWMLFHDAKSFNQNIGGWNVSNVESMSSMFRGASSFNADISSWNTQNVTSMSSMFLDANLFNADISNWNVGSLENMQGMFTKASSFNADISNWDISSVTDMKWIFNNATSFNQDLSRWKIRSLKRAEFMFNNSGLSCENWGRILIGWATYEKSPSHLELGAIGLFYPEAALMFRNYLTNEKFWKIEGDLFDSSCFISTSSFPEIVKITVFPNPSLGEVTITSNRNIHSFDLISNNGERSTIVNNSQTNEIKINLQKGVYYIIIKDGSHNHRYKVIIV